MYAPLFFPVRATWLTHSILLTNHPDKWQIYAIHSTGMKEGVHIQQRTSAYEHKFKARSGREMSNYGKGSAEIKRANKTSSSQKAQYTDQFKTSGICHKKYVYTGKHNCKIRSSGPLKYKYLNNWKYTSRRETHACRNNIENIVPCNVLKSECPVMYWKQSIL